MGKIKERFTVSELNSLFNYKEGTLFWKPRTEITAYDKVFNTRFANKKAGCPNRKGYYRIRVDGVSYQVHRLIYYMFNGVEPDLVDHFDGDVSNNLIENLRSATLLINARNRKKHRDNTSGHSNVFLKNNMFHVNIRHKGKQKFIGSFSTVDKALVARDNFKNQTGYTDRYKNNG